MDYHAMMQGETPASKVMSIEGLIINIVSYIPTTNSKSRHDKSVNSISTLTTFSSLSRTFHECSRRDEIWDNALRDRSYNNLGSSFYSKALIKSLSVKELRALAKLRAYHDTGFLSGMMQCIEKSEMQMLCLNTFSSLSVLHAIQQRKEGVPSFSGFNNLAFGAYASQSLDSFRKLISEEELTSVRGFMLGFKQQSQYDEADMRPFEQQPEGPAAGLFNHPFPEKTAEQKRNTRDLRGFTSCFFMKNHTFNMDDYVQNGNLHWNWRGGGLVLFQKKMEEGRDGGSIVFAKEVGDLETFSENIPPEFLAEVERFSIYGYAVSVSNYPVHTICRGDGSNERTEGSFEIENGHVRMFSK